MGVVLSALLLAAADPVFAAFRYIPPGRDTTVEKRGAGPGDAEHVIVEDPNNGNSSKESEPGDAGPDVWRVHPGETLREVLARWGARAGVAVVFLTDRGYRLHGGHAFEGEFFGSVEALFSALGHLPHPPAARLAPGGRSLTVTHRTPATGDQP